MRGAILVGLALCAGLAACGSPVENAATARNASSNGKSVDLAGKSATCLPASKLGMYSPTNELVGEIRTRFLTPQASLARVRVFTADSSVSNYGSTTVVYTNETADCVLWAEGLSLQEFVQRAGMTPLGISPFYQPDVPKPAAPATTTTVTPTPAPTPTPTAAPAPSTN